MYINQSHIEAIATSNKEQISKVLFVMRGWMLVLQNTSSRRDNNHTMQQGPRKVLLIMNLCKFSEDRSLGDTEGPTFASG
jgi:hypothetical protein